jgi:DNA-binding NarL/FixJ family response regulator
VLAASEIIFKEGLKQILKQQKTLPLKIVAETTHIKELHRLIKKHAPQIVIVDLQKQEINDFRDKYHSFPAWKASIILISEPNTEENILDLLAAGIKAWLLKPINTVELMWAIEAVHQGEPYYCRSATTIFLRSALKTKKSKEEEKKDFNKSEIKVMQGICQQQSSKEIAEVLGVSPRTVDHYRLRIQRKTGARNAVGIALYAVAHHLVLI